MKFEALTICGARVSRVEVVFRSVVMKSSPHCVSATPSRLVISALVSQL